MLKTNERKVLALYLMGRVFTFSYDLPISINLHRGDKRAYQLLCTRFDLTFLPGISLTHVVYVLSSRFLFPAVRKKLLRKSGLVLDVPYS